jgi:hypothetical protein
MESFAQSSRDSPLHRLGKGIRLHARFVAAQFGSRDTQHCVTFGWVACRLGSFGKVAFNCCQPAFNFLRQQWLARDKVMAIPL